MLTICVLLVVAGFLIIYLLAKRRSEKWTAEEIPMFLRRVDLCLLGDLLNPATEARLRSELSPRAFRRVQRGRIRGAIEQIKRIFHNSRLYLSWGTEEYKRIVAKKNPSQFDLRERMIEELVQVAGEVNQSASVTLSKLTLWRGLIVCFVLPAPSLSDLNGVTKANLLRAYESLISSAAGLMLLGDQGQYEVAREGL